MSRDNFRKQQVLQNLEWDEDGKCPICQRYMQRGHTDDCALGDALYSEATVEDQDWDDLNHRFVSQFKDFRRIAVLTYYGRCEKDREELGVGYLGSVPFWIHIGTLLESDGWEQGNIEEWYERGLKVQERAEKQEEEDRKAQKGRGAVGT